MAYIICFVISVYLMYLAETYEYNCRYKKARIYIYLSAGILVMLAFFRSETVGYDVRVYQRYMYDVAERSGNLKTYFLDAYVGQGEVGYALVTFLASRFHFFPLVFLFNELLVIIFVYLAIWGYRYEVLPHMSLLCFCFVYYLVSYDAARQSIAMAMVLYSIIAIDNGKKKAGVLCAISSFFFHKSAIIIVGIIYLYYRSKKKYSVFTMITIVCVTIILVFNFRKFFLWLGTIFTFLPSRYFTNRYLFNERGFDFTLTSFVYILVCIVAVLLLGKCKARDRISNYDFFLYMMLLCIGRVGIGSQSTFIYRIFYYPEMFSIFVLPKTELIFVNNKKNMMILRAIILAFLIAYYFSTFVYRNSGAVFPYSINEVFLQ